MDPSSLLDQFDSLSDSSILEALRFSFHTDWFPWREAKVWLAFYNKCLTRIGPVKDYYVYYHSKSEWISAFEYALALTQFPTPGNEGNHKMSVPFEKLKEDYVLTKTLSAFPSVWWSFKAQPQIPVKLRLEEAECEDFFSNRRFRLYSDEIKGLAR